MLEMRLVVCWVKITKYLWNVWDVWLGEYWYDLNKNRCQLERYRVENWLMGKLKVLEK